MTSTRRVPRATATVAGLTVLAALVPHGPLDQAVALLGTFTLLGAPATVALVDDRVDAGLRRLLALVLGLAGYLGLGLALALLGPRFDIAHPLSRAPQVVLVVVIAIATVLLAWWRGSDCVSDLLPARRRPSLAALSALLPLAALVGVALANAHGEVTLARLVGLAILAVALVAVLVPRARHASTRLTLLASAFLAACWQVQFRGGWLSGWDDQHEYAVAAATVRGGVFPLPTAHGHNPDAYRWMLSLTTWPAQVHALTGLSLLTIMGLLPALALTAAMALLWFGVRPHTNDRVATALVGILIAGCAPFVQVLPEVTRQCWSLLFFALALVALAHPELTPRARRVLVLVGLLGAGLTHYSTALLGLAVLAVGLVALVSARGGRHYRGVAIAFAALALLTAGYELVVAHVGTSLAQAWDSLTGTSTTGSLVGHLLHGGTTSVSAARYRALDVANRHHLFPWMHVDPLAATSYWPDAHFAHNHGIASVGALVHLGLALIALLPLGLGLGAAWLLWRRRASALHRLWLGLVLGAVAVDVVARLSPTVATYFGADRAPAQMNMVLVLTVGVALGSLASRHRPQWQRHAGWFLTGALLLLALGQSTTLASFLQPGTGLSASYNTGGQSLAQNPTPVDLVSATWLSAHAPSHQIVQADAYAQLALYDEGFATRRNFFATADPAVLAERAWLYADAVNVRQGIDVEVGHGVTTDARFALRYFQSTRSVYFASGSTIIFGPDVKVSS